MLSEAKHLWPFYLTELTEILPFAQHDIVS